MNPHGDKCDRLTFWRNWYEASRSLSDELRLAWLDAVLDYAFEGKVPDVPGAGSSAADSIAYSAVMTVKATIKISRKRAESGAKGGKTEAKRKQTQSKAEANAKQNGSKCEANAKQVQVQVQEQEQVCSTATRKSPSLKVFLAGAEQIGVPAEYARQVHGELEMFGWADADGRHIGNWRRYLKTIWEQKKSAPRASSVGVGIDDIGIIGEDD